MFGYLLKIFHKMLENQDIRKYKNKLRYYLLFRLIRKKLKGSLKIKIYNFYVWASNKKNKQSHSLLRKCDFEDLQELKLIKEICSQKKTIFFDCGANFGFYSLFVSSLSKDNKIIAFEASPDTFEDLKKNVILNNFKNIEYINKAVSDKTDTEIKFIESENDWESSLSNLEFDILKSVYIKTIKLDDFLQHEDIKSYNYNIVIKLDVEGHEMSVLKGGLNLIKSETPLIIIEFSKFISAEDYNIMKTFLNQNDYVIYDDKYKSINIDTVIKRLDNLSTNMYGIGNNFLVKKNSYFEKIINKL